MRRGAACCSATSLRQASRQPCPLGCQSTLVQGAGPGRLQCSCRRCEAAGTGASVAHAPPSARHVAQTFENCFGLLRPCRLPADGVDTAPALEGLIAQARPAHGTLSVPIRAAAAAVGGGGGEAGGATTLIVRAVTDEQAQVRSPQARRLRSCCACAPAQLACHGLRAQPSGGMSAKACHAMDACAALPCPALQQACHCPPMLVPCRCCWSRRRAMRSCSAATSPPSSLMRSSQVHACAMQQGLGGGGGHCAAAACTHSSPAVLPTLLCAPCPPPCLQAASVRRKSACLRWPRQPGTSCPACSLKPTRWMPAPSW